MYLTTIFTAILQFTAIVLAADPLYTVSDKQGPGTVTITATKVYNIWNNYGNTTSYTVELFSPLINSTSQEIRVAIQWQWKTKLGTENERVAFYGEVSKQRFDEFKVDRFIQVNGSYQFENWFLPVLPKDSQILPPQHPEDLEKYVFIQSEKSEIQLENNTAKFTFTVNRDEPYSDENRVWINWGVFDSPIDTDLSKVYGSVDSHSYEMALFFSDYFDRVFVNGMYLTLCLVGGLSFWLALPLEIVPMTVLLLYLYFQPVAVFSIVPNSANFTFDQFFFEVILRWQLGSMIVLGSMILGDIMTYIPLGWVWYQYTQTSGNLSTVDFAIFWVQLVITWLLQFTLHVAPATLTIAFLNQ